MRALSEEQITREDLVTFINAGFACTGQQEFYGARGAQAVSIGFLHEYILGNYRRLYARTLAAGVNHFNQALIVENLLATGRHATPEQRREEGGLIREALARLPPPRVYRLFAALARRGVNNRRSRASIRDWLAGRDLVFDAVKYRGKLRHVSRHAHLRHPGELGPFLFAGWKQRRYETELFERFRQAHYAKSAVLDLPFSVADGLAARHGLDRSALIAGASMTASERLRARAEAERRGVEAPELDLARVPLTRLALYVLSLPLERREAEQDALHAALQQSARRALDRAPLRLGRVAAVLDNSASSSGSAEKRRRPLAVALAAGYLLDAASEACTLHWTRPPEHPVLVQARGQTRLAAPLIDALRTGAELVVIVSDGFDNDPPDGVAEVCRVFQHLQARRRAARGGEEAEGSGPPPTRVELVHMNPVFDAEHYAPRAFGPDLPTVGLRDAEDLPTMLGFARFADGGAPLSELERYLEARIATWREGAP